MFYQIKQLTVKEGASNLVVERFSGTGLIDQQPGFLSKEVLVKKVRRGEETVLVLIKWDSEESWKNWEKSPEHIAGHKKKAKEGTPKPEYILAGSQDVYYVKSAI